MLLNHTRSEQPNKPFLLLFCYPSHSNERHVNERLAVALFYVILKHETGGILSKLKLDFRIKTLESGYLHNPLY